MLAVKQSTRTGRSRRSISYELALDDLDVDELDISQKSDNDDYMEPKPKSVKATQKSVGEIVSSRKRDKEGNPKKESDEPAKDKKDKKEPKEKKDKDAKAPKDKKEKEPKAAKAPKEEKKAEGGAKKPADKEAKPTGKPGEKEKEKLDIMNIADTKKAIEGYLVKHNRPYSIQDILNSF
jgi:hypothetical protein